MKSRIIDIPTIKDKRGCLSFVESKQDIPFDIKRIYYLYDVPQGEARGYHAHKNLQQLMIPIVGSFNVKLDDGFSIKNFNLCSQSEGLYISSMVWREITNFKKGSVCMVLASIKYLESDYIRDYNDFISELNKI